MKPTFEDLVKEIPTKVDLYYVDYRDSLDEHLDLLQTSISENNFDEICNKIYEDWYIDCEYTEDIINDLKISLSKDFDEEEIQIAIDENYDELIDIIRDRDDSDVLKDLLRNTNKQVFFYSLGYEVADNEYRDEKKELRKIKSILGISKDKTHDNAILEMLRNASYGGDLRIFFYDNVENYINVDNYIVEKDFKNIKFSNIELGVIDDVNGSGWYCSLPIETKAYKFNRENLILDKSLKYNFTNAICGMYDDWCKDTKVELNVKTRTSKIEKSSVSNYMEQEKKYNETFKNGGCSAGDMDIKRHRDVKYINEYPCGSRCPHCGTFWID